jgi:anti-anti-sigma regulatory factor
VRCETCLLTSEEGAAISLEALLDRMEACDECPIALGQEACPAVALERLVQSCRASSRALRKLGNKARKAERAVQELIETTADYEERAAKLERLQQASTREADHELRTKMALVEQKEAAILALSTPIIEVGEGVLVLPLIGGIDGERAGVILTTLLEMVSHRRATHAILDLTGVDRVDKGTADHIVTICRAVALLGARVLLSGIRPEVGRALVALRVDLASIATERNLKEALRRCGVGRLSRGG